MASIRGTQNSLIPRLVKIVELGVTYTDVKAIVGSDKVRGLTSRTEVHLIVNLKLNPLKDLELPCRTMLVKHGDLVERGRLLEVKA